VAPFTSSPCSFLSSKREEKMASLSGFESSSSSLSFSSSSVESTNLALAAALRFGPSLMAGTKPSLLSASLSEMPP